MNEYCECPARGWCTRHKMEKSVREYQFCRLEANIPDGGAGYWNDWERGESGATAPDDPHFVGRQPSSPPSSVNRHRAGVNVPVIVSTTAGGSKIGDRLERIIEQRAGAAVACPVCKREIARLNEMTPDQVRQDRGNLAQRISNRVSRKAPRLWQRVAAVIDDTLGAGVVAARITKWIDEAIEEEEQEKRGKNTMKWACGVTTVRSRLDDLLPRTLESIKLAGFDPPWIFVDGETDPTPYQKFDNVGITIRNPNIRTHGNWILSLYELYIRIPDAERYAVFQDDFVTYKNLRPYLEKTPYPEKGYCNLYTFPENQRLCPAGHTGWYQSNQRGRGAVALVFTLDAIIVLLTSAHMIDRPQSPKRGWRAVDGGIVDSFKKAGWREYVHNPSLVQHTGTVSSMGNKKQALANSFVGEEYDALEIGA